MTRKTKNNVLILLLLVFGLTNTQYTIAQRSKVYRADVPFVQEFSTKYNFDNSRITLEKVVSDRNGYIQVLSSHGLMRPRAGQMLFPGTLVKDLQYRPTSDKGIKDIDVYKNQLIYIDDEAVFSNAWAGKLYSRHEMPNAKLFSVGSDFTFLISDGIELNLLKDSETLWKGTADGAVEEIKFDEKNSLFWILTENSISAFSLSKKKLEKVADNTDITCIEVAGERLFAGTKDGYFEMDTKTKKQVGQVHKKLPWTEITTIREIDGRVWFGSTWGAFMLKDDGKFSYYAGKRWIPSDNVADIAKGPDNSILILTDKGLGQIMRKEMTLYDKAMYFEKQVRERHIRFGFNSTISGITEGDVTIGSLRTDDNDGLWTSMYLAGEVFRYAVTHSDEALQNIHSSMDAMERLYSVNPVPGFPSRSFERRGYKYNDKPWRRAEDPEWDWKSTTSSDEAIGHIFAFGAIAELVDVPELKDRAVMLIDTLMSTILKKDYYLVDWNGKPTQWGRWNPDYVNGRPKMVGDRKLTSSNFVGMLQTAYHFTKKEKYKDAAFKLMDKYGYLENLIRPMSEIGKAPEDADPLSKNLSDGWNHSDDEMYYCGYWGLYRYAFDNKLKAMYKKAIVDHWEAERPEKEGLWNIMTAIVGNENYDYDEAIWYLQGYPLDLIDWTVMNSQRKDIEEIESNFRRQTIAEVLPPQELRISRHNANRFDLDSRGEGRSEYSAGDIWLLPYWIGRYLNVIGEPVQK